jgi:hypothetical protein
MLLPQQKGERMNVPVTLREFVGQLQLAQVIPLPDGEDWPALIARISIPGQIAAINEEGFWYFLEVLPPKYQRGNLFAFAEGAEALRLFWQKGDSYFCRQLTWDETTDFCRLARISLPW